MEDDKINTPDSDSGSQKQDNSDLNSSDNAQDTSASFFQKALENEKLIKALRITIGTIVSVVAILIFVIFFLYLVPGLQEITSGQKQSLNTILN